MKPLAAGVTRDHIGARIEIIRVNTAGVHGLDIVALYLTHGSEGGLADVYVGSFRRNPETDRLEPCTSLGCTLRDDDPRRTLLDWTAQTCGLAALGGKS